MPQITLNDISLKNYSLTDRVSQLKDAYFKAVPEICVERPQLLTKFHVENGLFNGKISVLDKARAYRHVLQKRIPVIRHSQSFDREMNPFSFTDRQLFAGSTTTRFKGVPLYPEFLSLTLWPELHTMSKRKSNPFHITESEARTLNIDVFPRWMDHTILEIARKRSYEKNEQKYGIKNSAPEIKLLEQLVFFLAGKTECISHTIPDFSKAITSGLKSLINEASRLEAEATDPSRQQFYAAMCEAMKGIIEYSKNLADEAGRLAAEEQDPVQKAELLQIAEINSRVPELPARTFREGLTTVWICWTAIHLENPNAAMSPGRLDQLLYDLYRRDVDSGAMTVADALEMLCCFWLKIGDHVLAVPETSEQLFGGAGSNQAITIGGVDSNGADAVNDLTYVILRAIELMKLRDPNLNARYYPGVNSEEYLRRLCEANLNTHATPAIHNDKAVIKALISKGDTLEQARDYGIVGCVEPTSNARTYASSGSILLNLASALELALFNGRHRHTGLDNLISIETGQCETFTSFDQFKSAFEKQIRWVVDKAVTLNNLCGEVHQDYYPTPILSCLMEGPMKNGMDLIRGGATINSSGATIIGLADVADSLSAIEKVVFEEKASSFSQILDALKNNFNGCKALQTRLLNPDKTPKYGNDNAQADSNVTWILKTVDDVFSEKKNYRGGRYRVGYWTMTNHAGLGKFIGALPSGRKGGESLASGITPVSSVTPELIRALHSVANQPASCLSSGIALNLKYTPEDDAKMLDNFTATVESYFDDAGGQKDGGMEIQFNIVDHDTLVDAVLHPEDHPPLLVRVSGYTAYFKDLNPQMQKEIIDRTEYLLSTGKMTPFAPFQIP